MNDFDNLLIPIWKDSDWTSNDIIKFIKPYLKPHKIGHTGTLDPFAEGILLICIGKMTKQVSNLMELKKEYHARIMLGMRTDTLDLTGQINKEKKYIKKKDSFINEVLTNFIGEINQVPPMFSALKHKGQRLYKLARQGVKIQRDPRPVFIESINLLTNNEKYIDIEVVCGKGTYIRSLARDIAIQLGTHGYLSKLARTKVGDFDFDSSINIKDFKSWILSQHHLQN